MRGTQKPHNLKRNHNQGFPTLKPTFAQKEKLPNQNAHNNYTTEV